MATIRPAKFPSIGPETVKKQSTDQVKPNHGRSTPVANTKNTAIHRSAANHAVIAKHITASEARPTKFYHPKNAATKVPAKLGQVIDIKV